MSHQMVTITGQVTNPTLHPARGWIEPTSTVVSDSLGIGLGTVRFDVATDGTFSVTVPATDSDDLRPVDFTYRLGIRAGFVEIIDEIVFRAPHATPVLYLGDIVPVGTPMEADQYASLSQRIALIEGGESAGAVAAALSTHIASPTPHAAYDTDLQDLATLLENGLA